MTEDSVLWPNWATEDVEIIGYDPAWAVRGARERGRLRALLAPWIAGGIEHVGSTAVPGLAAKPIIDLQALVTGLDVADAVAAVLALHQWHYVPPHLDRRGDRRFFVKVIDGHRTAHLHLLTNDSVRWHQQLTFRDALCIDPDLVGAYAELKIQLAKRHRHDREAYTAGKQLFINDVLTRHAHGH
ncbi:GrpB family protein [Mycobacteroides salmoniphilum]|uniref:GrpB family protein n=1 Tax=Mycobacteroides salmoniphilum TaxID=404941 RepID=UPI0035687A03